MDAERVLRGIDKEVFVGDDALQLEETFFVEVDEHGAQGMGLDKFFTEAVFETVHKVCIGRVAEDDAGDGLDVFLVPAVAEDAAVGAAVDEVGVVQVEVIKAARERRLQMVVNGVDEFVVEAQAFELFELVAEHRRERMVFAFPSEDDEVFEVAVFVFGLFEVVHVNDVVGGEDEAAYDAQVVGVGLVAVDAVFVVQEPHEEANAVFAADDAIVFDFQANAVEIVDAGLAGAVGAGFGEVGFVNEA